MSANQVKLCEQIDTIALAKDKLLKNTIRSNATACNNVSHKAFDLEKAQKQSESDLIALHCEDGIQAMLAA